MSSWVPISQRKPTEAEGTVYVWHKYQGVMLTAWDKLQNRFFQYWMPITHIYWNNATEIGPTKADADVMGCVLVKGESCEMRIAGWQIFRTSGLYTHWARLPHPPEE